MLMNLSLPVVELSHRWDLKARKMLALREDNSKTQKSYLAECAAAALSISKIIKNTYSSCVGVGWLNENNTGITKQ